MTEEAQVSALRDNINKKGSNAYYYAHGATANGPAWDGKEEPRLLSTGEKTERKHFSVEFESFSWLDSDSSVKIYIDFPEAGEVADDEISLVSLQRDDVIESPIAHDVVVYHCSR